LPEIKLLKDRERAFVFQLPFTGYNASEAARRVYTGRYAYQYGAVMFRKPHVRRAVDIVRAFIAKRAAQAVDYQIVHAIKISADMLELALRNLKKFQDLIHKKKHREVTEPLQRASQEAERWSKQAHTWKENLDRLNGFLSAEQRTEVTVRIKELSGMTAADLAMLNEAIRKRLGLPEHQAERQLEVAVAKTQADSAR